MGRFFSVVAFIGLFICFGSIPAVYAYQWFQYGGHYYTLTDNWETWAQAEAEAASLGGHLATINNSAENTWLMNTFTSTYTRSHTGDAAHSIAWIGYYYDAGSNSWKWISGEPVAFENYYYAWPQGGTRAFISLATHPDGAGQWNANPDHDTNYSMNPKGIIEVTTPQAPAYHFVDLTGLANFTWVSHAETDPNGTTAIYFPGGPVGNVTLGGIPFNISSNAGAHQAWNAYTASSGGSQQVSITIKAGIYGVTDVYTLINTYWGSNQSLASLVFTGSDGANYTLNLTGRSDIRDWCAYPYINGVSTVNVYAESSSPINGAQGFLDMQKITLPSEFATQRLETIKLIDNGGTGIQRVILDGITVKANDKRATLALIKSGAGSGTITSSPSGINCGATCSASYGPGTSITLTVVPATGSYFSGFSCAGSSSCTFILTANTQIGATFGLQSPDYYDTVQKCYIGYYQRPADPGGLLWWAERLKEAKGNLSAIIEAFATSDESKALYGEVNNTTISTVVDGIYMGLLSRASSKEENDYWSGLFKEGKISSAAIMLIMLNGAQNEDLTTITNKLTAANRFTKTIDPELDGAALRATYAGDNDARNARSFLTPVITSVPSQTEVTDYIKTYIADPGDAILGQ